MDITALGYFGTGTRDLDDWRDFGVNFLGLQLLDQSRSALAFRMDHWKQRIVVDKATPDGERLFGWEVADAKALDSLAARLDRADVKVARETSQTADARYVADLISFKDPAGNRIEVFHGPQHHDAPFEPGRSISGFRTGAHGLGHVVLTVEQIDAVMPFYVDLLGFRLSDFILAPFKAYFFHVNPRHHSLALIETGRNGMHHLMLEYFSFDDVGQGYDIALSQENRIGVTLGRHTNDYMTSFYANAPSAFMVECGWGGREINPAQWQPHEFVAGPSMWGHERSWLSPAEREEAKRMRMMAAAQGLRQPVHVIPGNYRQMAGACPWWDALKADDKAYQRPDKVSTKQVTPHV